MAAGRAASNASGPAGPAADLPRRSANASAAKGRQESGAIARELGGRLRGERSCFLFPRVGARGISAPWRVHEHRPEAAQPRPQHDLRRTKGGGLRAKGGPKTVLKVPGKWTKDGPDAG